ncbi:MAG: hypothetical protein ACFB2Z_08540 [Maricaulaceae bacterium]
MVDHAFDQRLAKGEQALQTGRPNGVADIRGVFVDGLVDGEEIKAGEYEAALFLATPHPALDGDAPLDVLSRPVSADCIDRLKSIAEGDLQGDFS